MLATQNASTENLSPTAYGAINDCKEELPCAEDVRTLMVSDIAHQMAGGTPPSTATALPKVRSSTAINIRRGMAQQRALQASFRKTGLGSKSLDQAFGSPQSLDHRTAQKRQLAAL